MENKLQISIVVPVYNEDESLPELCEWISRVCHAHHFSHEVILIDDGSTDQSWTVIANLSAKYPEIRGIKFTRNYGKSAALQTGFNICRGDVVITMDADMQDSPDEIPVLYSRIKDEGLDLVSGWKKKRKDPISKTIPSKFFNAVTRIISGIKLNDFNCGLKAYRREVIKNIQVYGEMHRYIPVIAKWNGFKKIGEQVVEHRPRKYGHTKFGLERFINGFLDLLSITFVMKFRRKPMHFFGTLGTLSFLFGLIFTVKIIWDKLYSIYFSKVPIARDVTDQPLFFLALVALIIGSQLFLAGFLAEMMAMRDSNKHEYLISERIGE
jgi:glycosyltransferase involved in cell wall biosynthesis